jgi:hypothetical protein
MSYPHARRLPIPSAVALVAILAACSPNGSGSPGPSGSPGTTPEPSSSPVGIEHEMGATDVVLQFEEGGGLVPMGFLAGQAPTFTLYGDGTVIFRDWSQQQPAAIGDAQPQLPFQTIKLTEEEIQQLLEYVIGPGALGIARANYDAGNCADCPTAIFTINAGGTSKTVSVTGLGFENPQSPDALILKQLADAGTRLREFKAANAAIWQPDRYRGILSTDAFGNPRDWPWPDLAPSDWHEITTANGSTWNARAMTAAEIDALGMDNLEGGVINVVMSGPGDGKVYSFTLRPLLPDEAE